MQNIIQEFFKRPIAYQPIVAKAFDSVTLAILWCQFYYWSDRTSDPDGWIYKTRKDVFDETGLGRKQQETARRIGGKLGVLESKRIGIRGVVHFRVDPDKAFKIIEAYALKNPSEKNTFNRAQSIKINKEEIVATPEWINQEAWSEWEKHRKEIKKKLTPTCRKSQFKFLEKYKESHVEIIKTSIQNGWTGLFPVKIANNKFGQEQKPPAPVKTFTGLKTRSKEEQERINKRLDEVRNNLLKNRIIH
jgi:hypothetical protein